MLDILIKAFQRINNQAIRILRLEQEVADLQQRLSRKPKSKTTQVQLALEFDLEEIGK